MLLTSVSPVYSIMPAQNTIHVVEWRQYRDPDTNKTYTQSVEYNITLYNSAGVETQHSNKSVIDVMV
jgi:hypothetical protein